MASNCSDGNPEKKEVEVTVFRRLLPQLLAVGAKNTLALNFGLSIGFQTIAIPALMKPNDDFHMTAEQISWFGSLFFMSVPVGCLLSGPLTHQWGRRSVMLLFCLPLFVAWIVYIVATGPVAMYVGIILHGLVNGLLEAPILTYVAEVSEPRWRGALASSSSIFSLVGIFLEFLLGNLMSWRRAATISAALPLLSFVTIFFVPESPHWLISRDRKLDAEKSLCWLRGWVPPSAVSAELASLSADHATPAPSPTSPAAYIRTSFLKPLFIVVGAFFVGHFSGMATIQTYAVRIFKQLGVEDGYGWTGWMGAGQVAGATLSTIVIPLVGKRPVAMLGMLGAAGGLCAAATAPPGLTAAIPLLVANFSTNACSRVMPWVLMAEVFSNEMRAVGSGLASCLGFLMGFALTLSYLQVEAALGFRNLLLTYAAVALAGVLLYWAAPETEGKSLSQIQDEMNGSKKPRKSTGVNITGVDNPAFASK